MPKSPMPCSLRRRGLLHTAFAWSILLATATNLRTQQPQQEHAQEPTPEPTDVLLDALRDGTADTRQRTLMAIAGLGPSGAPTLRRVLAEIRGLQPTDYDTLLQGLGAEGALEVLLAVCNGPLRKGRLAASSRYMEPHLRLEALARRGGEVAWMRPILQQIEAVSDASLADSVQRCLAAIGEPVAAQLANAPAGRVLPGLLLQLRRLDAGVGEHPLDAARAGLQCGDELVQALALKVIARVDWADARTLMPQLFQLACTDTDLAIAALERAGELGKRRNPADALTDCLPDAAGQELAGTARQRTRLALFWRAKVQGRPVPIGIVAHGILDPSPAFRIAAIDGTYRRIAPQRQAQMLAPLLLDAHRAVRRRALEALRNHGLEQDASPALPQLQQWFESGPARREWDPIPGILFAIGEPALPVIARRIDRELADLRAGRVTNEAMMLSDLWQLGPVGQPLAGRLLDARDIDDTHAREWIVRALASMQLTAAHPEYERFQAAVLDALRRAKDERDGRVLSDLQAPLERMGADAHFALRDLLELADRIGAFDGALGPAERLLLRIRLRDEAASLVRDTRPFVARGDGGNVVGRIHVMHEVASIGPAAVALLPDIAGNLGHLQRDDVLRAFDALAPHCPRPDADRLAATLVADCAVDDGEIDLRAILLGHLGAAGVEALAARMQAGDALAHQLGRHVLFFVAERNPLLTWQHCKQFPTHRRTLLNGLGNAQTMQPWMLDVAKAHLDVDDCRMAAFAMLARFGDEAFAIVEAELRRSQMRASDAFHSYCNTYRRTPYLREGVLFCRRCDDEYLRNGMAKLLVSINVRQLIVKDVDTLEQLGLDPADRPAVVAPLLGRILAAEDVDLRRAAVRALIQLRHVDRDIVTKLHAMIVAPDSAMRRVGELAYAALLPVAVERGLTDVFDHGLDLGLDVALASGEHDTRRRWMQSAGEIGPYDGRLLPLVVDGLLDPEPKVRIAALEALGTWRSAARPARPAISGLLDDPDPAVAQAARAALRSVE